MITRRKFLASFTAAPALASLQKTSVLWPAGAIAAASGPANRRPSHAAFNFFAARHSEARSMARAVFAEAGSGIESPLTRSLVALYERLLGWRRKSTFVVALGTARVLDPRSPAMRAGNRRSTAAAARASSRGLHSGSRLSTSYMSMAHRCTSTPSCTGSSPMAHERMTNASRPGQFWAPHALKVVGCLAGN
jgi:hypothetical protein